MGKIRCPINETAHMSQNQPGIISDQGGLLYTEVEQLVTATHELLMRQGVQQGDYVGVAVRNGWEQVVLFWALLRLGAVMCPMYGAAPSEALCRIIDDLGVKYLVTDRQGERFEGVQVLDLKALVGFTAKFKAEYRPSLQLEAPAVVQYAVDAEGNARYVLHTVGSCYYAALGGNGTISLSSKDNHWLMKPLFSWTGTDVLFRCAIAGAAVVVKEHLDAGVEEINKYDITHLTLESVTEVETLNGNLQDTESELKHVLYRGKIEPSLRKALREAGNVQLTSCLGTPETGYYAVVSQDKRIQPLRYHVVRLGEQGTLEVRGRGLCAGYVLKGDVQSCTDASGWFDTGIKAVQDGSGDLFF